MCYATDGTRAPILKALQTADPRQLPFSDYIARSNAFSLVKTHVAPPAFAAAPAFTWNLGGLLKPAYKDTPLRLDVNDPYSIDNAREILKEASSLDTSQVDCMVQTLVQEFSMIQG